MAPPYAAQQHEKRGPRIEERTSERKCALAGRFLKIKWRPASSDVAGDEEKGEEGGSQ